jgi:hypothetical protein
LLNYLFCYEFEGSIEHLNFSLFEADVCLGLE